MVPARALSPEQSSAPPRLLMRLAPVPLELCLLPPLLIIAALFRFDALTQRGLIFWDEGKFTLEGLNLYVRLETLTGSHAMALTGKTIGTAKPTHALLIALSYALLGVHDYAPLMFNAAASVLQVGLLFLLARRLFGVRVALLATALLAVAGYDILYARSALSESDANLFFICGVLVWSLTVVHRAKLEVATVSAALRTRVLAGFLLGLGFTTNYRLVVYIAVLVGLDLVIVCKRRGWRSGTQALVLWIAGVAVCPMLWEIVGLVARGHGVILFRSEITHRPTSYFSEVLYQIHGGRQAALRFNPLLYVEWYRIRQGWPMLLLLGAGIGLAVVRRAAELAHPRRAGPGAVCALLVCTGFCSTQPRCDHPLFVSPGCRGTHDRYQCALPSPHRRGGTADPVVRPRGLRRRTRLAPYDPTFGLCGSSALRARSRDRERTHRQ